ncbi:MAG: type II toxin-antitoxin system mRNA interferase toxin, RelE/StbE family [Methanophagales archaeon]|nr:type II toxin-antitoxin system mRNA interferase toxin, RelE/StbE family [Methanophagales archaeon]
MYRARLLNSFLKQEKKLNAEVKGRVIEAVEEILSDPYSGVDLKGNLRGYRDKRVGKYRIVYKIDESEKRVIFFDVDLRKRVYNRLKRRKQFSCI